MTSDLYHPTSDTVHAIAGAVMGIRQGMTQVEAAAGETALICAVHLMWGFMNDMQRHFLRQQWPSEADLIESTVRLYRSTFKITQGD